MRRIDIIAGGDHGQVAFQAGARIVVILKKGQLIFEVSVAEVLCRKDNADILQKTIEPRLSRGLEGISKSSLNIACDANGCVLSCSFSCFAAQQSECSVIQKNVHLYVVGDLAFYAMVLGRESMSGNWCYL